MYLRCGVVFHHDCYKFIAKCASERISESVFDKLIKLGEFWTTWYNVMRGIQCCTEVLCSEVFASTTV